MKLKFFARTLLIDCGKASKMTRGTFVGALTEVSAPPSNRYH